MSHVIVCMDDMPTYWIAETVEDAIKDYIEECGEEAYAKGDMYVLNDADLDNHFMADQDDDGHTVSDRSVSFREGIERHVRGGYDIPGFFAGTE